MRGRHVVVQGVLDGRCHILLGVQVGLIEVVSSMIGIGKHGHIGKDS